jgi:zinc-ribbon domain
LSRTQGATIRVISYLDIAAAAILALLALFALLWIGRRRHVRALMWATAAPARAVRRLPIGRGAEATTRKMPSARSTLAATMSDVAGVGRGPGAEAVGFVRELFMALGRAIRRAVVGVGRSISSAGRRTAGAGQRAVDRATPSWPTPDPATVEAQPTIRPAVASRTAAARMDAPRPVTTTPSGSTWFDAPGDDEGPTHDCSRCGRPVPDSARFCRSCGHQQF